MDGEIWEGKNQEFFAQKKIKKKFKFSNLIYSILKPVLVREFQMKLWKIRSSKSWNFSKPAQEFLKKTCYARLRVANETFFDFWQKVTADSRNNNLWWMARFEKKISFFSWKYFFFEKVQIFKFDLLYFKTSSGEGISDEIMGKSVFFLGIQIM